MNLTKLTTPFSPPGSSNAAPPSTQHPIANIQHPLQPTPGPPPGCQLPRVGLQRKLPPPCNQRLLPGRPAHQSTTGRAGHQLAVLARLAPGGQLPDTQRNRSRNKRTTKHGECGGAGEQRLNPDLYDWFDLFDFSHWVGKDELGFVTLHYKKQLCQPL